MRGNLGRAASLLIATMLAATAFAANNVVVTPAEGFLYSNTRVVITGTGLAPINADCTDKCAVPICPVTVTFGGYPATVHTATWSKIVLDVPPRHFEGVVDIQISATGIPGFTVIKNAFTYSKSAVGSATDFSSFLVPLTRTNVGGLFGSSWVTELRALLRPQGPQVVFRAPSCPATVDCPPAFLQHSDTLEIQLYPSLSGGEGAFIHVPTDALPFVSMGLRARDTSRDAFSLGSEIPLVTPQQFRRNIRFLGVPSDPRYRATLRLYGLGAAPFEVRVTVSPEDSEPSIAVFHPMLTAGDTVEVPLPNHPQYATLDPLTTEVRLKLGSRGRIEVEAPENKLIWGLLSITNNDTQQVTVISPGP